MGCKKLNTDFFNFLEIVHSEKSDREQKKCINYYPFGLQHRGYNNVVNGTEYPYDYQGKENQEELGLNWHDFGARQYDAAIGRWMSSDPLSEEFSSWSPYNAMKNNPIHFIDPTGMAAEDWYQDGDGNYVYDSNVTSQQDLDDAGIEGNYLGETVNITVNGGDDVTLNKDGSVTAGGETYSSEGGSSIDFNWKSGNKVYSGGENAGNARGNYYSSLFGRGTAGDAAMVSYGAAGFSSIPFPKSWLAKTPSWFHGGYGRGWTKGSKFTSIGSFSYRRLTGGGNAGRALPLTFARAGNTLLMLADTYIQYNNFITNPAVVNLWNQNNSNLSGYGQSLINTSAAANGFRTPHRTSRSSSTSFWSLFSAGTSQMGVPPSIGRDKN